jgi:RNA polymerase sigma-70 factor, ECF subfamily
MILLESRALLDGFRRGDKSALYEVYRHYVSDVTRFLMRGFTFTSGGRLCSFRGFRGGYEIEGAIQEVFRRAFEDRARLAYDGINPYRPYLFRIARNLVINDLKAKEPILFRFRAGQAVVLEPAEEELPEALPAPSRSPEEELEIREVAKLVAAFKSELTVRELGVFERRFEKGLSAEKAAAELSLTRSQVRTTETKLRERFLKHMQSSGYLSHYRADPSALSKSMATIASLMCWGL